MGLTCSSMFSLFLGIASANGVHVPNIDLIREHRVMGHALELDHTVTKIKLTLEFRSYKVYFKST